MNSASSFKYVFFDLLALIEHLPIEYGHDADICQFETLESAGELVHGVQWKLKILSFANEKPWLFEKELSRVIESIRTHLELNQLNLIKFYGEFIKQLEEKVLTFEQLDKGSVTFESLHNNEVVKLDYKGYLPYDEGVEVAMKNGELKAEFDEFSYNEIYRLTASKFKILTKSLKKLIFFLGHKLNLATTQQEKLNNQKEENKYIKLIKLGKIKTVFSELDKDKKYTLDLNYISLCARFHTLENDKKSNLIKREDYEHQRANIIYTLIILVQEE